MISINKLVPYVAQPNPNYTPRVVDVLNYDDRLVEVMDRRTLQRTSILRGTFDLFYKPYCPTEVKGY